MCLILDTSMTVITYSGKSVDADQLTSLKPADLYLHGFKKQDYYGYTQTQYFTPCCLQALIEGTVVRQCSLRQAHQITFWSPLQ